MNYIRILRRSGFKKKTGVLLLEWFYMEVTHHIIGNAHHVVTYGNQRLRIELYKKKDVNNVQLIEHAKDTQSQMSYLLNN